MKIIEQREKMLLEHEVRTNTVQLKDLLHDEFIEIWGCWSTWNYDVVFESLIWEEKPNFQSHNQNYSFVDFKEGVIQVFYEQYNLSIDWKKSKFSKRMSLWFNVEWTWKIRYHQVTPIDKLSKI